MDFVIGLPKVSGGFDAIFVVVDRLTKVAHLNPIRATATAADVAQLFVKEIVRLHGIPTRIILAIVMLNSPQNFGKPCFNLWEPF